MGQIVDVFITDESALEYWRLFRLSKDKRTHRPSQKKLPCESPDSYALRHGETWGISLPLDIMLSARNARRPSKAIRPHVCFGPLPDGVFVNADNGLYVSSPEFCFFRMASEYPLAKLIALGIELCGSYTLPPKASNSEEQSDPKKTPYNLPQLTSKKKLKAFVDHMGGWPGYKQALKALHYISDGSASPMETILAILLTLPYKYGGYGLPMPELNGRIFPKKGMGQFAGRGFYRGDLLWRKDDLVAEYNSYQEHADPNYIIKDAVRRGDLALRGITEVTVTKEQIKSTALFDKIAKQIAARLGRRLRYDDAEFNKARRDLRNVFF